MLYCRSGHKMNMNEYVNLYSAQLEKTSRALKILARAPYRPTVVLNLYRAMR